MNPFAAIRWVATSELRSAARDRSTLIYVVLMPLALYPVIGWILLQGLTLFCCNYTVF